jgi:hypothetical protein
MAFNFSPKVVTDGLVLYLDAANTKSYVSGSTTWNDVSRSGINGTLVNGPTFSSENGGGIIFDGIDDYVSTTQRLTNPSFSYEVFLKPTNVSKDQMYIGNELLFALYARINNSRAFVSIRTNVAQRTLTHPQLLLNNNIYHIVSIYNGVQLKIYVNNVLSVGSVINETLLTPWGTSSIGRWINTDTRNFVGNIYTVRLYNRELSSQEVLQNYNATKTRFGL